MNTPTKKAPGRPKKAQAPAQAVAPAAPAKKKKPTIRRKEEVNQHKEYEITKGGGIVFMLPQKGVTVYDKENDTVREIRYCPNEQSIFRDEQSENAKRESVSFKEGRLFVPKGKTKLAEVLRATSFK